MKGPRNKKMKNEEAAKIDHISELPDSILSHILSFLDIRSAVTTSVLSRRWNLLWTYRETLHFKYDEPTTNFKCGFPFPFWPSKSTLKYTRWVRNFLSKRVNSPLTKFHLTVKRIVDPNFVEDCIAYAASHNVQELKVRAYCEPRPVQLPDLLFTCQPLRSLKLSNVVNNSITLPRSFTFPNLKTLRLSKFVFSNQNYSKNIFMGCPNLETLVLYKCNVRPELKVLDISCLMLKNLEILYWRSPCRHAIEGSIHVNAPQLVSFTFKGLITKVQFMDDLPCLETVCIDLCYGRSCTDFDAIDGYPRTAQMLMNMLGRLSAMKFVSLSVDTIEVLSAVHDLKEFATCEFANVQYLKFTVEDKCGQMVIPVHTVKHLLECSADVNLMLDLSEVDKLYALGDVHYSIIDYILSDAIPRHVISYLLEISPSVESLVVEF